MNILVVSGSPRKEGNTIGIVKIVETKMAELDHDISFDYLHLIDRDLRYCRGCTACLRLGGEHCPLKDDAQDILSCMRAADGIIFVSPGYASMVSALFKNFIDRFMYLDHIPELIAKPVLIVSTSGGDGIMGAPKYMRDWSLLWWGCNVVGTVGIGHAFFTLNEGYRSRAMGRLTKISEAFFDAVRLQPKESPGFKQYLCFLYNKMELLISPTVMPFRTKTWNERGWMKMNYYYETALNPLFKLTGFLLFRCVKAVYGVLLGPGGGARLAEYVRNN